MGRGPLLPLGLTRYLTESWVIGKSKTSPARRGRTGPDAAGEANGFPS